jgi:hypothetical protein
MLLIVSFGGFKSVFQQRGNSHGTNATRYGSDIAGALCSRSKVDVTDEGTVILTVNADINHHGAWFDPFALHNAGLANGNND